MSAAGLVAFNLLANGVLAFLAAWLLAGSAIRVMRVPPGRAHVAIAALPFAKLVVESARGVPSTSFLWLRAQGIPQDLGSFRIGFGLERGVPLIQLLLGALSRGEQYTQSAADLVAALLARLVGAWAPSAMAALLLGVGLFRLAARVRAWRRAAHERAVVGRSAVVVGRRRIGFRNVAIFVSPVLEGSPFTGGVVFPYVCFPERAWNALGPVERRAALAHELAHVAEHHVLLTTLIGIVRDVFWFVPFGARAELRLREACELAADGRAGRRGAPPAVVASALLRVAEAALPTRRLAPTLAASDAPVHVRIERLLEPQTPSRLGALAPWVRGALTVWIAAAVFAAVAFGNH